MEMLGERPAWSMSDSEKLSALDAVFAECARLETIGLHLIAGLEQSGHAKDLGAADTAELLSLRYRIDTTKARRDVRVATALTQHPTLAAALPDPATPFPDPATAHPDTTDTTDTTGTDDTTDASGTDDPAAPDADGEPDGGLTGSVGWRVHPAQAEAIVSILAKVPATVPVENIAVAEQELIGLAATHTPAQLRQAGKQIRAILDPDGPAPDETKAYTREALTLKPAEQGVTFRGYLANENAELFRTLIHAGSKPHKTRDGELDPRPRAKRQADALTTVLNTAANAHLTTRPAPTPHATSNTRNPASTGKPGTTPDATGTTDTATATTAEPATTSSPATTNAAAPTATGAGTAASPADAVQDPLPRTTDPEHPDAIQQPGGTESGATDHPAPIGRLGGPDQCGGADAGNASGSSGRGDGEVGGDGSVAGGFVPGYGPKAHINVTIDFNDLKTATATATGTLVFGDNLSAATIRRLACDADILPIVLGTKSQPLDVGTSQRLATRAIRRALNTRDKGCVICAAPPIQCEAHHLTHWIDGGPTAVSNMVLLCKRHHIDLHAGHWHIHITNGIVHVTRPTWANPAPIPRGRYRPPITDLQTTGDTAPAWPGSPRHAPTNTTHPRPSTATNTTAFDPWGEHPGSPPPTPVTDTAALNPWGDDPTTGNPARTPDADAAHLNPCGDDPEPAPEPADPSPSARRASLNPWGEDSEPAPRSTDVRPPVTDATDLDPWGDASTTEPGRSASNQARIHPPDLAGFDPWGDDMSTATAGCVDPAGSLDEDSPVSTGGDSAEVDPWGEAMAGAAVATN